MEMPEVLLSCADLVKHFPVTSGFLSKTIGQIHAVDGVSFYIREGETLGVVGESGCGKTTVGRTILRLIEPTSGEVRFEGKDVFRLKKGDLKRLRRDMQMIFQDPFSSLDPRKTVFSIVGEPLRVHRLAKGKELKGTVLSLIERVALKEEDLYKYPHEFSGGQRQRIGIARALITNPRFIVLDEPTSARDVSVQAQILNLLKDLQRDLGLTYLFISHNLNVVKFMSDRVAVMYLGKVVESDITEDLFRSPLHPYTQALLSSIPIPDPKMKYEQITLKGEVPSRMNPPPGCRFHPRCQYAERNCAEKVPALKRIDGEHFVACLRA